MFSDASFDLANITPRVLRTPIFPKKVLQCCGWTKSRSRCRMKGTVRHTDGFYCCAAHTKQVRGADDWYNKPESHWEAKCYVCDVANGVHSCSGCTRTCCDGCAHLGDDDGRLQQDDDVFLCLLCPGATGVAPPPHETDEVLANLRQLARAAADNTALDSELAALEDAEDAEDAGDAADPADAPPLEAARGNTAVPSAASARAAAIRAAMGAGGRALGGVDADAADRQDGAITAAELARINAANPSGRPVAARGTLDPDHAPLRGHLSDISNIIYDPVVRPPRATGSARVTGARVDRTRRVAADDDELPTPLCNHDGLPELGVDRSKEAVERRRLYFGKAGEVFTESGLGKINELAKATLDDGCVRLTRDEAADKVPLCLARLNLFLLKQEVFHGGHSHPSCRLLVQNCAKLARHIAQFLADDVAPAPAIQSIKDQVSAWRNPDPLLDFASGIDKDIIASNFGGYANTARNTSSRDRSTRERSGACFHCNKADTTAASCPSTQCVRRRKDAADLAAFRRAAAAAPAKKPPGG